ncbi:MAG TPA: hypothetical protein VLG50_02345, partial [Candidatus Saccharimonadales bacterium]|nr:hypothetical protein [Candidatus Saccharimonadales bacterium]
MKKLLLIVISVCLIPNNYGGWRELQQQEANQIAAADLGQKKKAQYVTSSAGSAGSADAGGSGSGSCSNDCSQCTSGDGSDASATTAMPAIAAVIQDSQGNLLTSQTFQNANFKYNNGLLSVHIFPPSNGVTASADPTYYIVYTFKSLNGNTLRKYVQGPTSTTTTGTSSLSFNSFPASVSVYLASDLGTDTNGNTLLPPNISPLASSTFLPSSTKPKVQQQLFNLMCPQSQDFLISQSGSSSATATSISGVFENSKGTITLSSGSGGGGGGNQQISVQINNQS